MSIKNQLVKKITVAAYCMAIISLAVGSSVSTATETDTNEVLMSIQKELKALQENQEKIQEQIADLTKKVNSRPAARSRNRDLDNVTVSLEGDPVRGDENASLVLLEFSDYQCPFCGRHTKNTSPQLIKEYVDTGIIRYAFKDLPLERIHKEAFLAAMAANCAGEQNQYWSMHGLLFENPKAIEPVAPYAEQLGLDMDQFNECIASERYAQEVRDDLAEARKLGISSTPTFIFGKPNPDGSVSGVRLVKGAVAFSKFKEEIDALLKKADKAE